MTRKALVAGLALALTCCGASSPAARAPARPRAGCETPACGAPSEPDLAGATVDELCARLLERSQASLAPLLARGAPCVGTDCTEVSGGAAWIVTEELVSASPVVERDGFEVWDALTAARLHLVRAGRVVTLELGRTAYDAGVPADRSPVEVSNEFSILGAFDWSGDGVPEVVVASAERFQRGTTAYTFDGAAIVPYGPVAAVAADVEELVDEDGDGRPDLVVAGPFSFRGGDCLGENPGEYELAPRIVVHSLPDGTFSRDDEVVRAYVRRTCAAARWPETFDHCDIGETVLAATCARWLGRTGDETRARIRGILARSSSPDVLICGDCSGTLDDLLGVAGTDPPFLLAP